MFYEWADAETGLLNGCVVLWIGAEDFKHGNWSKIFYNAGHKEAAQTLYVARRSLLKK